MTDYVISDNWLLELVSMHVSDARKREIRDTVFNKYPLSAELKKERGRVLDVVKQLYDVGFKDPLVTVECAIKYIEDPTVPGFPEKQSLRGEP